MDSYCGFTAPPARLLPGQSSTRDHSDIAEGTAFCPTSPCQGRSRAMGRNHHPRLAQRIPPAMRILPLPFHACSRSHCKVRARIPTPSPGALKTPKQLTPRNDLPALPERRRAKSRVLSGPSRAAPPDPLRAHSPADPPYVSGRTSARCAGFATPFGQDSLTDRVAFFCGRSVFSPRSLLHLRHQIKCRPRDFRPCKTAPTCARARSAMSVPGARNTVSRASRSPLCLQAPSSSRSSEETRTRLRSRR